MFFQKFNEWWVCKVMGVDHQPMASRILRDLPRGDRLYIRREPQNPHDPYAIAVCLKDGKRLGYIPKELAKALAGSLDKGEPYIVHNRDGQSIRLRLHPGRHYPDCPTCVLPPDNVRFEDWEKEDRQMRLL